MQNIVSSRIPKVHQGQTQRDAAWEYDGLGDLMPTGSLVLFVDEAFELDGDGAVTPRASFNTDTFWTKPTVGELAPA